MCKRRRTPGDRARPEPRSAQLGSGSRSAQLGSGWRSTATRLRRGGTRGSPTGPLLDRAGASGCPDSNWGPLRPERSALPGFGVGEPVVPPRAPSWIVLAHRGAQIRTGDLSDPNGARYPASAWGNPWFPHGPPPGSCWRIGVPRFELGTSPTRTERATRLRHTPDRAIG